VQLGEIYLGEWDDCFLMDFDFERFNFKFIGREYDQGGFS
jgi:hypothetical protein